MNNFTESTTYGSSSGGVIDKNSWTTQTNMFASTETADGSDTTGEQGPIFWWKIVSFLVIFLIGTVGNLLSLFVIIILKEYKKSVLHMYVLQLAFADLCFLLTIPFKITEDIHREWPFADWLCAAKETMLFFNYNASVLFLMVMSIDRYIAVCHSFSPVLTKLREPLAAGCIICLVWLISILSCLPVIHNTHKAGTEPTCICQFSFPPLLPSLSDKIKDECGEPADPECVADVEPIFKQEIKERENNPHCSKGMEARRSAVSNGSESLDYSDVSGNYSGDVSGNYSGDVSGDVSGNYSGDVSGDVSGNYSGDVSGDVSGNYSGDVSGNYSNSGDYSADGYEEDLQEDNDDVLENGCHYFGSSPQWFTFIRTNFVVLYILPILVMAVTYGCIIYKVKNTNMPKATTTSFTNSDNLKRKKSNKLNIRNRVTIMSATLVSSFIICWLPFHAYHLAKINGIRVPKDKGYICENLLIFASQMGYVNSVINPYLYSILGTDFGKRWRNVQTTITKRTGQDVSRKTTKLQSVDSISQTKATNVSRGKASMTRSSGGELLA